MSCWTYPESVPCPSAGGDTTPCVRRMGRFATSGENTCIGCREDVGDVALMLARQLVEVRHQLQQATGGVETRELPVVPAAPQRPRPRPRIPKSVR